MLVSTACYRPDYLTFTPVRFVCRALYHRIYCTTPYWTNTDSLTPVRWCINRFRFFFTQVVVISSAILEKSFCLNLDFLFVHWFRCCCFSSTPPIVRGLTIGKTKSFNVLHILTIIRYRKTNKIKSSCVINVKFSKKKKRRAKKRFYFL